MRRRCLRLSISAALAAACVFFHVADKNKNAHWCMALELTPAALAGKAGTINIQ